MIKAKVKRLFFHYKHLTFDDSKLPTGSQPPALPAPPRPLERGSWGEASQLFNVSSTK